MLQQSLSLENSEASAKKGATKIAALNGWWSISQTPEKFSWIIGKRWTLVVKYSIQWH
jgi:hypothetical protein